MRRCKLGEDGYPIIEIVWLAAAHGMPLLQVRDQAFHRADQQVREVNPMTEHVAQFAGAGELLDLPPAQAARAPILQAARPEMIRLAQVAALDEMRQIPHRRHETVSERRHVPHTGAIRGLGHGLGIGVIQRERLLAQNMFAVRDGVQRDRRVGEVRRGNDDSVNVIASDDFFMLCRSDRHAGLLPGALQRGCIGVAERGHLHIGAQRETGEMILQRDAATTDDGDIESAGRRHGEVEYGEVSGKGKSSTGAQLDSAWLTHDLSWANNSRSERPCGAKPLLVEVCRQAGIPPVLEHAVNLFR